MIEFESVYRGHKNIEFLYELLKERTPDQSISHQAMPTFEQHEAFVQSRPYFLWNVIKESGQPVGSIYLTQNREIGVFIAQYYRGYGYAKEAIRLLQSVSPGEFLANVNPKNTRSIKLFESLGFKHIQNTYKL